MTFIPVLGSDPKNGMLSKPKLVKFGYGKALGFWKGPIVTATQTAPCRSPLCQEALLARNLTQVLEKHGCNPKVWETVEFSTNFTICGF